MKVTGLKTMIVEGEKPYIANHRGEKLAEFPVAPEVLGEKRGKYHYNDLGQTYNFLVLDIDGDGHEEVVAFNRKRLAQFKIVR